MNEYSERELELIQEKVEKIVADGKHNMAPLVFANNRLCVFSALDFYLNFVPNFLINVGGEGAMADSPMAMVNRRSSLEEYGYFFSVLRPDMFIPETNLMNATLNIFSGLMSQLAKQGVDPNKMDVLIMGKELSFIFRKGDPNNGVAPIIKEFENENKVLYNFISTSKSDRESEFGKGDFKYINTLEDLVDIYGKDFVVDLDNRGGVLND